MDSDDDVLAVQAAYPRVWHACHRHLDRRSELTERESMLLAHLADPTLRTPARLAAHLGIAASTLSEGLDGLVERGLVTRARRDEDRRRVDLSLTDDGRDVLRRGSPLDPERLGAALATLDDDERRRAVEGLLLLARACTAMTRETA